VCGKQHVSPLFIHGKSRRRKRACTDLRGGRSGWSSLPRQLLVAGVISPLHFAEWTTEYRRFWEKSFDRLDEYLRELKAMPRKVASRKETGHARRKRKS
jgi:hypothetical protein